MGMFRMKWQIHFLAISILGSSLFSLSLYGIGLHIINKTGQPVVVRMSTWATEYWMTLPSRQSQFISNFPMNMTVYSAQGYCSQFNNIFMNPTIFDTLYIGGGPQCLVLWYTGNTRQQSPRLVGPVPIEPNICKRNCWNPTTGWLAPQNTSGILTGTLAPSTTNIVGVGTAMAEPNPMMT